MMYLVRVVYSLRPRPGGYTCLASLDEYGLWGVTIEGQCGRIVGDGLVISLGIHCCISKMLQFPEATLPEIWQKMLCKR